MRESGSIEQDADLVMFLHRQKPNRDEEEVIDERNNQVELILAKHRNGSIIDGLPLNFVAEQTRFENIYSNADNN